MKTIPVSIAALPEKTTQSLLTEIKDALLPDSGVALEYDSFKILLTELIRDHFTAAVSRMMPLLEDVHIRNIHIETGVGRSSALAWYSPSKSDEGTGTYYLTAGAELVRQYLRKQYQDADLNKEALTVWEHELIHLLDHKNLVEMKYDYKSPDVVEAFVKLILKYRSEGIAEFFYLMDGHTVYRSIQAARTQFNRKMDAIGNMRWNNRNIARYAYDFVESDFSCYPIGVWMILHVLGCPAFRDYSAEATMVAAKIKKRQPVAGDVIMDLVKKALRIDNETFISCITKPGTDGKPFVAYSDLYDVARTIEIGRADQARNWSVPTGLSGDERIVQLFRIMRPKPEAY